MNLFSRLTGRSMLEADAAMAKAITYGRQIGGASTPSGSRPIEIGNSFEGYISGVHKRSGVIAAAVLSRALLISQLRFLWRNATTTQDGGKVFGTDALSPLEGPDRSRMLHLAETYVSYGGTAFFYRAQGSDQIRVLRPDWVKVLIGSNTNPADPSWQLDAEIVGYVYLPGGNQQNPQGLLPSEVSRWMTEPDPVAFWRGESWVTSLLTEFTNDTQANEHINAFYSNAATPQIVFSLDASVTPDQAEEYARIIDRGSAGARNAYRNLVIGGGAQATVVGSQLSQLDQKSTQRVFESRVAVRSRVPAVVLGIQDGLEGSSLNAGNYGQTRRLWSDGWFNPAADSLCAALDPLMDTPPGRVELSFDRGRIDFLQEDRKDEAEIQAQFASAINTLVLGGFVPETAVVAVTTSDFSKLKHTGLPTVQVQDHAPTNGGKP